MNHEETVDAAERRRRDRLETAAVIHLGTLSDIELLGFGRLTEDRLLALVRAEVFKPFDRFARWQKISYREVRHRDGCGAWGVGRMPLLNGEDAITFETCELDEKSLNDYGRETLAEIRLAHAHGLGSLIAVDSTVVEPLTHWASCRGCVAELARSSVKVSITWAGRTLTREYAL